MDVASGPREARQDKPVMPWGKPFPLFALLLRRFLGPLTRQQLSRSPRPCVRKASGQSLRWPVTSLALVAWSRLSRRRSLRYFSVPKGGTAFVLNSRV
ncbi:MAG: hypothetical protein FWD61_08130 [Phycisphaerales bacterium]|nr:hypothetical protein [Phycisphaerales bacterium]